MPELTPEHLRAIVASVEPAWPDEGCGLILRAPDGAVHVRPCKNRANALHAIDPEAYPRTARTYYDIDPREYTLWAEQRGDQVLAIYHSHCDVGDYFSDEDRRAASINQREEEGPVWPDFAFLVVSVMQGVARRATTYRYDPTTRRFEATEVYEDLGGRATS